MVENQQIEIEIYRSVQNINIFVRIGIGSGTHLLNPMDTKIYQYDVLYLN